MNDDPLDNPFNDHPINHDDALRRAFEQADAAAEHHRRIVGVAALVLAITGSVCLMVALVAALSGTPESGIVLFLAGAGVVMMAGWLDLESKDPPQT